MEQQINDRNFWNVLIFTAFSEHIRRTATHEKGTVCCRFQLWAILICRAMSVNICHKPIDKKTVANDQAQLLSILIFGVVSDYIIGMKDDPFRNLPEDMQRIILSKLDLKEIVRTSALSRNWRFLWQVTPKLHFDGITMCGNNICGKQQYTQKFINNVYAVLLQCRGRIVEDLAIKFDFEAMLIAHLNNWVRFAVASRSKFLAFDLVLADFAVRNDRYMFPFKLLVKGSISRLQTIQLGFVSLQPPTRFSGFPNLRKLDLNLVHVSGEDLSNMLSNCHKLEWLRVVRCHLCDELKVNRPLPCLVYLNVLFCRITNIALQAVNLATFEYKGLPVPIDLSKSTRLETANIRYFRDTLEHAVSALANVLMNVKRLTLNIPCRPPEIPCLWDYPCKFSLLKHLKLMLLFVDDVDSMSLASFLSTVCFIEKLELHFSVVGYVYFVQGPTRKLLDRPLFNRMKSLCMMGFKACHGQVELLVHLVENGPALEALTIDVSNKYKPKEHEYRDERYVDLVHGTAR